MHCAQPILDSLDFKLWELVSAELKNIYIYIMLCTRLLPAAAICSLTCHSVRATRQVCTLSRRLGTAPHLGTASGVLGGWLPAAVASSNYYPLFISKQASSSKGSPRTVCVCTFQLAITLRAISDATTPPPTMPLIFPPSHQC